MLQSMPSPLFFAHDPRPLTTRSRRTRVLPSEPVAVAVMISPLQPPRGAEEPILRGPAGPRQRADAPVRGDRPLERRLPRTGGRGAEGPRRAGPRGVPASPLAAGVGAHNPHRRLPLGPRWFGGRWRGGFSSLEGARVAVPSRPAPRPPPRRPRTRRAARCRGAVPCPTRASATRTRTGRSAPCQMILAKQTSSRTTLPLARIDSALPTIGRPKASTVAGGRVRCPVKPVSTTASTRSGGTPTGERTSTLSTASRPSAVTAPLIATGR